MERQKNTEKCGNYKMTALVMFFIVYVKKLYKYCMYKH